MGIRFDYPSHFNLSSSSTAIEECNNENQCLLVFNKETNPKATITLLIQRGQQFHDRCQCDSLLEFAQYQYKQMFEKKNGFSLINDNQTMLNSNISATQMEYKIIRDTDVSQHIVIWTTVNNIFYTINYHNTDQDFSALVPDFKGFLKSIEFFDPNKKFDIAGNQLQSTLEKKEPSFMKKQPSFMTKNINQNKSLKSNDIINEANDTSENDFSSGISQMMDTPIDYDASSSNLVTKDIKQDKELNLNVTKYNIISNSIGSSEIIGEITNPTDNPLEFVKVGISIYENDKLSEVEDTYADISDLNPGQSSSFSMSLDKDYEDSNIRVEFIFDYDIMEKERKPYLSVNVVNQDLDKQKYSSYSTFKLLGQVVNMGSEDADSVKIEGLFYDGEGNIIEEGSTYVEPSSLKAGQTANFELSVWSENSRDIESYKLFADSNDYTYAQVIESYKQEENMEDKKRR